MIRLLIRADASRQIGTGHVMREFSLAQACRDAGGKVSFAAHTDAPALEQRLRGEGLVLHPVSTQPGSPEDAAETIKMARQAAADWVVLDGYHFTSQYQALIKGAGLRVLVVDDKGYAGPHPADLIQNQNLHASEELYPGRESRTRLLLGPSYVLLRREFMAWRGRQRSHPEKARRVLVTMGGSDGANHTLVVLKALLETRLQDLDVVVLVGAANPHAGELAEVIRGGGLNARMVRNAANMAELMAASDLAVCSGGTTVWELAFMGVPAIVGRIAPVEDLLISGLRKIGLYADAGWFSHVKTGELAAMIVDCFHNQTWRRDMGELGKTIVDGAGCERVLSALAQAS
jgi:UDP-2,4-diacetamido-2,4,6-trideoxy-beta-L-altropyranose hydrolase